MEQAGPSRVSSSGRVTRSPDPRVPRIHQIVLPTPWERVPSAMVYLIEGDPLTLVDAGVDDAASLAALEGGLDVLGYAPSDVKRVALTHEHVDRLGGVVALRRRGVELELCVHVEAVPAVEHFGSEPSDDVEGMEALFREFGVPAEDRAAFVVHRRARLEKQPRWAEATPVDRALHDGDDLDFKDFSLEVIHAPGHTAGHVLFTHRATGSLLAGHTITGGAMPYTENYYLEGLPEPDDPAHRRPRFQGLRAYRASLRRLKREGVRTILPGSGNAIRAADRAIREAMLFYDVRIQRIERSLRSVTAMGQAVTAYEIWRGMFPNDDVRTEMRDNLLMVIGALDVLEEEGLCVTRRRDDGVLAHAHAD